MVREPKLFVADEPTTLLDLPNTKLVTKVLHELSVEQLILITHDLELAATCDEVVWFEGSRVREIGKPKTTIANYLKAYA
jgi:biotin transport system ATP-binding protein